MILKDKVAVVFAANGAIGSHVAKAFAKEGAKVFLAGRNKPELNKLLKEIEDAKGWVEATYMDPTNEQEIDDCLKRIVKDFKKVDIVFNGIGLRPSENGYGKPTTELSFTDFMRPLQVHTGSQFLTSRLAAKYMIQTKTKGTILTLSASLSRLKIAFMAGVTASCNAVEGLTRVMAAEFGNHGIKVICMTPTAFPETRTIQETSAGVAKTMGMPPGEHRDEDPLKNYLLRKAPSLEEFGGMAAFLASDTGTLLNSHIIDIDCGTPDVI